MFQIYPKVSSINNKTWRNLVIRISIIRYQLLIFICIMQIYSFITNIIDYVNTVMILGVWS